MDQQAQSGSQAPQRQQWMQMAQALQSRMGQQNPFMAALQQRYAAPLTQGSMPYGPPGQLQQPAPFNFNVQPHAITPPPQMNPFGGGPTQQYGGIGGTNPGNWSH